MKTDEERMIKFKIAHLLAESLKDHGDFPSGSRLQEQVQKYADENKFRKTKFSLSDISRFKKAILTTDKIIDFSEIIVKTEHNDELASELKEKYKLEEAIVINRSYIIASGLSLNKYLGRTAAKFFNQTFPKSNIERTGKFNAKAGEFFIQQLKGSNNEEIETNKVLSLSCGETIHTFIKHLNCDFSDTSIYSSILLIKDTFKGLSPSELIHSFTSRHAGSTGVTFQIPSKIFDILREIKSLETNNVLSMRRFLYRNLIEHSLKGALQSDFLILGIGGPPADREAGGFSFLVNKLDCWDQLLDLCAGELSFWPVLKKNTDLQQYRSSETIWLWDAIRKEQLDHKEKSQKNRKEPQPEMSALYSKFYKYFDRTYTIDFNRLIEYKQLQADLLLEINNLFSRGDNTDTVESILSIIHQKRFQSLLGNYKITPNNLSNFLVDAINKRMTIIPAGGSSKIPAINQCLTHNHNFINVLITDSKTAEGLILIKD